MQILSEEAARSMLGGQSPDAFSRGLTTRLHLVQGTFAAPSNSGVQISLAKLFAYLLLTDAPLCLYVTGWGIAMEHMDLFDRYRASFGERRPLIESSFHVFEADEEDALVSLLCLVLFFSWDASVFDVSAKSLIRTSHDGWLEIRTSKDTVRQEALEQLSRYNLHLLGP